MTPLTQQLEDKKKELKGWRRSITSYKRCDECNDFLPETEINHCIEIIAILEQAIAEIKNKKVYCELCNGEDEASICKWCYQNLRDKVVPIPSAKFWREKSIRLNKELQKQRQEILEDELKFLNLGKIKIEGKTKDMEFLIRKRIQYLKQQLNQPKTENGIENTQRVTTDSITTDSKV